MLDHGFDSPYPWFSMKTLFKLRSSIAGSLAALSLISLILIVGTACQSKKGAKGNALVGDKVQMVELRTVIHSRVPDLNRASALISMVDFAEQELGAINQAYLDFSKKFGKMSANHSKGAPELHMVLRDWDAETTTRRRRLTDALLAMKGQATAKEWPAISRAFMNSVANQSDRYRSLHASNS